MIGIIGAGTMGKGIAVEFARYGFSVILVSYQRHLSQEDLHLEVSKLTDKFGFLNKQEILGNIKETNDLNLLSNCDLIIEAVAENLEMKRTAISEAKQYFKKSAILSSNTSSLSIKDIFNGIIPLTNVMGLHFFNPVQIMKLVELSYLGETNEDNIEFANRLLKTLEKEVVRVKDTPGFIVNRLLIPMINEAAKIVDEGIASVEDIDKALKFGANHPMGPLRLSDLIGNDITLKILEVLKQSNHEIVISKLLKALVDDNKLGRKTRTGFYSY